MIFLKRTFLFFFLLTGMYLVSFHITKASLIYDSGSPTRDLIYHENDISGMVTQNQFWQSQYAQASTTPQGWNLDSTATIGAVQVYLRADANTLSSSAYTDCKLQLVMNTSIYSTNRVEIFNLQSSFRAITFYFSATSTVNLASTTLNNIILEQQDSGACTSAGDIYAPMGAFGYPSTSVAVSHPHLTWWGSPQNGYVDENNIFAVKIYDQDGVPPAGQITFDPHNFTDNMITPDFQFWNMVINPSSTSRYDVRIKWGTSTPTTYTNSFTDQYDNFYMVEGTEYHTPVAKTPTSTPGTYIAEGYLYNWNGSTYTQVATTSLFHFTISSGSIVREPPSVEIAEIVNCQPTSFELLSVDFGQGMCQLFRFLFVPSSLSLDRWTALKEDAVTKQPISGFYQFQSAVTSGASSTASSTLAFTYNASSTMNHMNINIPLKVATTNLIGTTGFNLFYNGITYLLWFAVGVFAFWRVKNFF